MPPARSSGGITISCFVFGLALTPFAVRFLLRPAEAPPPSFEFGGHVSVVSVRASNGKFLQVSTEDGMVRATADTDDGVGTKFRVHVLSAATVDGLRLAASAAAPWSEATGGMVTASECRCTGSSNEHGFGRYCHPWEAMEEAPWCYVSDACAGSVRGSFGRAHDVCTPLNRFDDAPPSNASSEGAASVGGGDAPPAADEFKWQTPGGCACSGVRSPLGYGAYCMGWEYEGQVRSTRA
jgi:hypothetical protein